MSERDYYQAEKDREAAEIDATPQAERQEIRDIYAAKGFAGDLLERVVDTITANRDAWLATMMDEELPLQPVQAPDIFRSAVVITVATLIGHLIPLLPFLWLSRSAALINGLDKRIRRRLREAGDASTAARDLNDRDRVAVGIQRDRLPACLALSPDRTNRHTLRCQRRGCLLDIRHGHGHDAVAGVVRVADYVQPAAIRHLPHHLLLVRDDVSGPGEETFVPRLRCLEVADRDTSEENIDVHHLSLAVPATGCRSKRSNQTLNRSCKAG